MAIDTAAKRMSALRVSNPMARTLPIPDGTIGAGDRIHLLGGYGGLFGVVEVDLQPPFKARFTQPVHKAIWLRSD